MAVWQRIHEEPVDVFTATDRKFAVRLLTLTLQSYSGAAAVASGVPPAAASGAVADTAAVAADVATAVAVAAVATGGLSTSSE